MSTPKVIATALNEVGYLEKATNSNLYSKTGNAGSNNYTKFAYEFDTKYTTFYNGKKNGYPWCDVFVDWCFVTTYGEEVGRNMLCQPTKSAGAGCEYSIAYYKQKGRYGSTPKVGAQIFFNDSSGSPSHTGLVYAYDSNYVYTVEGNTSSASGVVANGGAVEKKQYSLNYNRINGYGYPNFDLAEANSEQETPTNTTEYTDYYGIDVSEHNGTLDWAKIKAAGIRFAIIRTGYGKSYTDSQFKANMAGAKAQGIPVGVYHFSYALDAAGAKKEAEYVINLLKDYTIDLPVFFDFEYDTVSYAAKQGVTLDKQAFNDHTVAFCETIKAAGYTPGTYYNLSYKNNYVDSSRLGGYVQWYAQYNNTADWNGYDIWQYSSSYRINGINANFDINFVPRAKVEKLFGKTTVKAGWKKDSTGWWYVKEDGTYPVSSWLEIDGEWYYFNEKGYMLESTEVEYDGYWYIFDENGHCTKKEAEKREDPEDSTPKEEEKEDENVVRYEKIGDVKSPVYVETLDKLVKKGFLKGRGGTGADRVIDLSEDAIRILVLLDRAGVFGD